MSRVRTYHNLSAPVYQSIITSLGSFVLAHVTNLNHWSKNTQRLHPHPTTRSFSLRARAQTWTSPRQSVSPTVINWWVLWMWRSSDMSTLLGERPPKSDRCRLTCGNILLGCFSLFQRLLTSVCGLCSHARVCLCVRASVRACARTPVFHIHISIDQIRLVNWQRRPKPKSIQQ